LNGRTTVSTFQSSRLEVNIGEPDGVRILIGFYETFSSGSNCSLMPIPLAIALLRPAPVAIMVQFFSSLFVRSPLYLPRTSPVEVLAHVDVVEPLRMTGEELKTGAAAELYSVEFGFQPCSCLEALHSSDPLSLLPMQTENNT